MERVEAVIRDCPLVSQVSSTWEGVPREGSESMGTHDKRVCMAAQLPMFEVLT